MSGNLLKLKCVCGSSELVVQMLRDNKYKITVPCILCPHSHSFTLSSGTFFQKDIFSLSCKFTAVDICFIGKDNKVYEALKQNEEDLVKTFAAYEEEYGKFFEDLSEDGMLFDGAGEYDDYDDEDFYEDEDEKEEEDFYEPGFILRKNTDFDEDKSNKSVKNNKKSESTDDNIDNMDNILLNSYQIVSQILDIISRLFDENKILCKCGDFDGKIVILGNAIHIECKNCASYRNIKSANVSDVEYLSEIEELYLDFDE